MVIIIAIVLLVGILIGILLVPDTIIEKVITQAQSTTKEIQIVGVDNKGDGIAAKMIVEVKSGTGLILVNINDVLADYQTQLSARTAAIVASNFTSVDISSFDIIYNVKANATIIEGPSAGAVMTLGTIAALQNKTINDSVFVTGTIEEDGSIGTVGGIGEKAKAAKQNNAQIFLIPDAKYTVGYDEARECKNLDGINYCEIAYISKKINLTDILGLEIIQIKNITEAANYILI